MWINIAIECSEFRRGSGVSYMVVSEAGASVYSASKLAAEEFPEFDLTLRSAVSIARRLQDPLAELVKIDPKAIGVGQYQHDMPKKRLDEALGGVVEDCVNNVGVDVNTASPSLLSHVSVSYTHLSWAIPFPWSVTSSRTLPGFIFWVTITVLSSPT